MHEREASLYSKFGQLAEVERLRLLTNSDFLEYVCNENEKDRVHLNTGVGTGM